jgi:hypothetical protein
MQASEGATMAEKSYEQAVRVLQDHVGARWEGGEEEGRDAMRRVLQTNLGYSRQEADVALDTLIRAGTLRYRHADGATTADEVRVAPGGQTSAVGLGLGSVAGTGTPGLPEAPIGPGHWEIGHEHAEASERKGQIDPAP